MAPMARYLLGRVRVGISGFLGILLAVTSINAAALGLGEIELDSALNEELDASIELLDVGSLAPNEILVSLASTEDFERVGVERFFFLTDLKFEVVIDNQGNAEVTVQTTRPVTEPYLNFIVQVMWPNGRLLKEFTLLLDPPTFSQAAAPAVAAPVETDRVTATTGRVQREAPAAGTRVQVAPQPARRTEPSPLDQDVVGDEFRMTDRNDTLWAIASRTRPSNRVSVQQNMLAIQRLNPDAFIDGNINLLKAGYALKLPDEAQATSLSQDQAIAAVANQNDAWRNGVSLAAAPVPAPAAETQSADSTSQRRSPVDATAASQPAATTTSGDGELRIVAGQGDSATGRAETPANEDVAAVLEENDRLSREIDELNYQREADQEIVTNQLAIKDRQLEVRDQQIAELQQRLAELEAARQTAAATPAPAAQNQNQNTTAANWWENPMILYGGAGVLVLALVGFMLARRKREPEDDFYETTAPSIGAGDEQSEAAMYVDEDDEDDEDFEVAAESSEPGEELPGSETSDVIGEADIYIAYGRYPQAIGLLLGVLGDDPDRNDVRLKLLELYSETNDREAFNEHLAALVEHCEDEDALMTARELESQFGEGAISLDDVLSADSDAESNLDLDEDKSLDDELDTLAADADLDAEADLDAASDLEISGDTEADEAGFELELDEPEASGEPDDESEVVSELGGDLGIDFDPDRDVDETSAEDEDAQSTDTLASTAVDEDHIDLEDMGISTDLDARTPGDGADRRHGSAAATQLDSDVAVAEEDDFDFQEEGDSANTKLDLARAYIDMGDADGARDILKEVVEEGNSEQKQQAQGMLDSL